MSQELRDEPPEETQERYDRKLTITSMFQGKMIVTVLSPIQAVAAEAAGAAAVIPINHIKMFMERIEGPGSNRSTELSAINSVMDRVLIPVIGRVRAGHIMEAKAMEAAKVCCIDEHELINPITTTYIPETNQYIAFKDGPDGAYGYAHKTTKMRIYKQPFKVPFICGAADLGEALKRIQEGASLVRTAYSVDDDTHDISKTFEMVRKINDSIAEIVNGDDVRLYTLASTYDVSIELLRMVKAAKRLPVPFFAAGCIFMPIDVAMLMSMGCDGVIVSTRVFKAMCPETRLNDIMTAIKHYDDPVQLAGIIERAGGYGPMPTVNG
ncbi:hypothetical protein IWW55_000635 [Coemansia sp. RSA 2706]|nr:hypothetical protein IWW55_000635 [Coemansia sp. RSA 2706]